jgi:class 3 adenylate cyclase
VVLFSDIRGFTTISEGMTPDDLVTTLNRYFTLMVDIIMASDRHGIIDKYIGDAIKAFFGAPVKREDDALNAVLAGIEMTEALEGFNDGQKSLGKPTFQIGVGINYGVCTVGNIGTEKKMDYTVIGDTVSFASRLEGLTKTYHHQLIISESLHSRVKDKVSCRLLDSVAFKDRAVKIYAPRQMLEQNEKDGWGNHNLGMAEYYDRNFSRAAAYFRAVQKALPRDEVAAMYLERCQRYMKEPPPPRWNGAEAEAG